MNGRPVWCVLIYTPWHMVLPRFSAFLMLHQMYNNTKSVDNLSKLRGYPRLLA